MTTPIGRFLPDLKVASSLAMQIDAPFNTITGEILSAIEVHRTIGPGLLESTYAECLQFELHARRLRFATQRVIPIAYKHIALATTYRVDLIVEDLVVVEIAARFAGGRTESMSAFTKGRSVAPFLRVYPFPPKPSVASIGPRSA